MPIQTSNVRPQPVLIMSVGSTPLISSVVAPQQGELADLLSARIEQRNCLGAWTSRLELHEKSGYEVALLANGQRDAQ